MFLKKFIYVNWGNIPSLEFEFGPVNLFSGGNGSGKTTAADAIQTIMTAAHENLFQYNPGQDETTQRGRGGKRVRTAASYVLGCDDGSYSRTAPTDGYLAAIFHPSKGEKGEPFTAIIAIRARIESTGNHKNARQDQIQFFIVPEKQLTLEHFVRKDGAGRTVVQLPSLYGLLVQEYGKKGVEKYENKKPYLRRLYAALRGRNDSVTELEAVSAARAFSRFMAYKPVQSINRFVAEEILEAKDLGDAVRDISSQLKTIHGMERDAHQLKESIGLLGKTRDSSASYIDQWIELNVYDYMLARSEYHQTQAKYQKNKANQKQQKAQQQEKEQAVDDLKHKEEVLRDQLVSLEAQRRGIDALRQKDELEQNKSTLENQLQQHAGGLLEEDRSLQNNLQASEEISALCDNHSLLADWVGNDLRRFQHLNQQVLDSRKHMLQDIHHVLQKDFDHNASAIENGMDAYRAVANVHNDWYEFWHQAHEAVTHKDQLALILQQRRNRQQTLADQRKQKQQEITRLENHQVTYPAFVERALKAISAACPQADPRVLCDHIEVKDAQWQAAIEGYLGGARFSILVEADYEAQAIRVVRQMQGRDNRARVIQGSQAQQDAARITLPEDSIIHVLAFSHAVAKAYLIASYGSVQRVESAETLRHTRRGLTMDGMGSGNYSMWRCDISDAELVFGAAARERALAAKTAELQTLDAEWHSASEQHDQMHRLFSSVEKIKPSRYADVLNKLISTQRELHKTESLLAQLDLSNHVELETQLQQLKQELLQTTTKNEKLNRELGHIEERLLEISVQIEALSRKKDEIIERVNQHEIQINEIAHTWPTFDAVTRLDHADEEAKSLNAEHSRNYRNELEKNLRSLEHKLSNEIQQHNQHCRPSDAIAYVAFSGDYDAKLFVTICELQKEVDRIFNVLKNNILVEKHEQLIELKKAFNHAFVTHLCHSIYQAMNDGKRQIDLLNKELQHHRFGADRETFRFDSQWVPEFRDYARFFEELVKNPQLADEASLFDLELSRKSKKVRDELMSMLLDEDEAKAMRELQRIADYRNYHRYEIYKEVEGKEPIPLSEYGTGSGGQLETPAYIIRSAAITSAFRFSQGQCHLRMVLVDEAFSKMDETRSREVIHYLTESLGLQLMFIMPTSKCGPFMDLISNEFVFAKVPSETLRGELNTRVLVDRKQCDQAKITELWQQHRHITYQQAELDFLAELEPA